MNNSIPYKTLISCVVLAFAGILILYAFIAPDAPISARVGFATFMSVIPGVLAWAVFKWTRLSRSRWNAVMLYIIWFVVVVVVQGWLRTL